MSDLENDKEYFGNLTTIEFRVEDSAEAKGWYSSLLGREPDFVFSDTYFEWEVAPETWLQIIEKMPFGGCGPIRFMVANIEAKLQELRNKVGDVHIVDDQNHINNTLRTVTILDPNGNQIGFLQSLE